MRDQISVELVVHILSLILTSLVKISVNFFFFFCHMQNVPLMTWRSIPSPVVDERELGEQTAFSYHSQLLSFCSSFFFFHLNVSWSDAAFGIYLTFHVLPNQHKC